MSVLYCLPEDNASLSSKLLRSVRCKAVRVSDFPGFEKILLNPEYNPDGYMETQLQKWNDCQAQSLNNGEEFTEGLLARLSGRRNATPAKRADSYSYALCELIDTGRVGGDNGSTISSGVESLVNGYRKQGLQPGTVLYSDWPPGYSRETTTGQFVARAKQVPVQNAVLAMHQAPLYFREAMASNAVGGRHHIGIDWPSNNSRRWRRASNGMRELVSATGGGVGGHAVEQIWAIFLDGVWKLLVWNSHGDGGHFLVGEKVWNQLVDMQFKPYGGYSIMPDKAEERFMTANEIAKGMRA
jgi:hypothetical protein